MRETTEGEESVD